MAYTAAHGPPLFDATHAWVPSAGTAPPVLNDCNKEPRVLPQIVIEGCENYYGLPELVANVVGKTVGVGTVRDPPRQLGKTMVYEGRIEASPRDTAGRESLMSTLTAMGRGFGNRTAEGTMTITPWTVPGGVVWTFTALVADFKPDKFPVLSDDLYLWSFSLTFQMTNPYFYTTGATYP